MSKFNKLILYILGLPKTIYFNFKYLSFFEALQLPIFVSHRVVLKSTEGRVYLAISKKIKPAMIKIGYGYVGIFDNSRSRSIWECSGEVVFYGETNIGHGSKICVGSIGKLEFGCGVEITAESQIVCVKHIILGKNVLISWQCLIMDTDFHKIISDGVVKNLDKEIVIGNDVWIGCRSTILKGVSITDGVVIAANSNVVKSIGEKNCIAGGNPAKALVNDIVWKK